MHKFKKIALVAAAVASTAAAPAFAVVAQPDTAESTAYIVAGAATVGALFGSKYTIGALIYIGNLIKGLIRR